MINKKKKKNVNYFAQKSRRPVELSATLDAQESILVMGSQENIWSACGTVISESQPPVVLLLFVKF